MRCRGASLLALVALARSSPDADCEKRDVIIVTAAARVADATDPAAHEAATEAMVAFLRENLSGASGASTGRSSAVECAVERHPICDTSGGGASSSPPLLLTVHVNLESGEETDEVARELAARLEDKEALKHEHGVTLIAVAPLIVHHHGRVAAGDACWDDHQDTRLLFKGCLKTGYAAFLITLPMLLAACLAAALGHALHGQRKLDQRNRALLADSRGETQNWMQLADEYQRPYWHNKLTGVTMHETPVAVLQQHQQRAGV